MKSYRVWLENFVLVTQTIKEIADKLSETAEAAVAAASAAHTMDEQRKIVSLEFERLSKDSVRQQEAAKLKLKELEEKTSALSKEKDQGACGHT
uniref:Uncharacterized protein n=1 Tax=Brassica campestris TaxID=3711 RepID=A0A3P5ZNX8_BRACM|nr:unnamed protein product [Brassica rapa]